MRTREGDFIENSGGLIFDVKGLVHPPDKVIAFIRYFPTSHGDRRRNQVAYGKVYSLLERHLLLKEKSPEYLVYDPVFDETLCEVPVHDVKTHFEPVKRIQELRSNVNLNVLERKTLHFVEILREEAKIPLNKFGISGSILVNLSASDSDIDLIVYGSKCCSKLYASLRSIRKDENSTLKPYDQKGLERLFEFRSKDTVVSYEQFVRTESKKLLQGKFAETDYFIRFVKDFDESDEVYGDNQYKNVGYAKIRALISDSSESVFTPCKYKVEEVEVIEGPKLGSILEIVSFRGRFCEQAKTHDEVIAQGKVECVIDNKRDSEYYRLLIGNKPSDFMLPKSAH